MRPHHRRQVHANSQPSTSITCRFVSLRRAATGT
jgi:hypothetical protein